MEKTPKEITETVRQAQSLKEQGYETAARFLLQSLIHINIEEEEDDIRQ